MEREQLRKYANLLKPRFIIGKNGLTEQTIKNITEVLKTDKVLKIKFLRTAFDNADKEKLVRQLLDSTDTQLVSLIGFNATITRNKLKKEKVL
jgi:RNA-binding protein